jgi:hypothetical protein
MEGQKALPRPGGTGIPNRSNIMNTIYTVLLDDDTVGTISSDTIDGQSAEGFIGEVMNVHLHDENGNPIERQGRLVEVLSAE